MRLVLAASLGLVACTTGSPPPPAPPTSEPPVADAAVAPAPPPPPPHVELGACYAEAPVAAFGGLLGDEIGETSPKEGGLRGVPAPPSPSPSPEKAAIKARIRSQLDAIRVCYETELVKRKTLAGTTRVEFVIDASGRVTEAKGHGFDRKVDACVARVIESIRFDPPTGGGVVAVSYPFTFMPADDAALADAPAPEKPPVADRPLRPTQAPQPDVVPVVGAPAATCTAEPAFPALVEARAALERCVLDAGRRAPSIGGRIVISFGKQPEVHASDDPRLDACVADAVAALMPPAASVCVVHVVDPRGPRLARSGHARGASQLPGWLARCDRWNADGARP